MVHVVQSNPLVIKPRHSDAVLKTGIVLTAAALAAAGIALVILITRSQNLAAQGPNTLVAPGATAGRFVDPGTVLEPLAINTGLPKAVLIASGTSAGVLGLATIAYAIYRRVHPTISARDRQYLQEEYETDQILREPSSSQKAQHLRIKLQTIYGNLAANLNHQGARNLMAINLQSNLQIQPIAIYSNDVLPKRDRYAAAYQHLANRIIQSHNQMISS